MENSHSSKPTGMVKVLSVMMFLQFFAWGAFFATMGAAFAANGLGDFIGGAYGGAPVAAIIAPLFLGLIADRWFNSEKVMAVLLITGGFVLFLVPGSALDSSDKLSQRNDKWMPWGITSQVVPEDTKKTINEFIDENGVDADFGPLVASIKAEMKKKEADGGVVLKDFKIRSAVDSQVALKKMSFLSAEAKAKLSGKFGDAKTPMNKALTEEKLQELLALAEGAKPEIDAASIAMGVKALYQNHLNQLAVAASKAGDEKKIVSAVGESLKQSGITASEEDIKEVAKLSVSGYNQGSWVNWLILFFLLGYMPTLGLGNTIAFTHIADQNDFPKIRVWGTIGWIVAGLFIGIIGWTASFNMFYVGAIGSILLGGFCFFLPSTPPPLKGKPLDLNSLLMVDAIKLLSDWNFLVFAVCSTLVCIPLAYYYGQTSTFLTHTGFTQASSTMTIGQMSEIFFMLLIPFFFRKLGVKVMILVGMACWVARYLLFAYGAPGQVTWMLLLAVALHGICYDFFFVTGFMYTDQKAPKEIRGQAQALLVFLTQGVGMFFGYWIMGYTYGRDVTAAGDYSTALQLAAGEGASLTFGQQLMGMFNKQLPEGLDQEILTQVMSQWSTFWVFPAIFAGVVMIVFGALFWDTTKPSKES